MKKNITGLAAFFMYFILVMFLPLLAAINANNNVLADNSYFFSTYIYLPSLLLMPLFIFKLQWLLLILPTIILKKRTKNPLLINIFTNLKLNNRILIFGIIFDIFVVIFTQTLNLYDTVYNIFYLLYLSFTSNYIVIYLIVLLHNKKQNIRNCLNPSGQYLTEYFQRNKNILGLTSFILFFILIMFLPLGLLLTFKYFTTEGGITLFTIYMSLIFGTLSFLSIFKLQWLIYILTVHHLAKNTKNPLLINLFTNLELNKKILNRGLIYDFFICMYAIQISTNNIYYVLIYLIYFSFTSNYIVIYLYALLQSRRKRT